MMSLFLFLQKFQKEQLQIVNMAGLQGLSKEIQQLKMWPSILDREDILSLESNNICSQVLRQLGLDMHNFN